MLLGEAKGNLLKFCGTRHGWMRRRPSSMTQSVSVCMNSFYFENGNGKDTLKMVVKHLQSVFRGVCRLVKAGGKARCRQLHTFTYVLSTISPGTPQGWTVCPYTTALLCCEDLKICGGCLPMSSRSYGWTECRSARLPSIKTKHMNFPPFPFYRVPHLP